MHLQVWSDQEQNTERDEDVRYPRLKRERIIFLHFGMLSLGIAPLYVKIDSASCANGNRSNSTSLSPLLPQPVRFCENNLTDTNPCTNRIKSKVCQVPPMAIQTNHFENAFVMFLSFLSLHSIVSTFFFFIVHKNNGQKEMKTARLLVEIGEALHTISMPKTVL